MKIKNIFYVLFACLFLQVSIFSQQFTGKVTNVIDGKTVVITTDQNKQINFQLLYIEVPEPEQELSAIVVEYLKRITANVTVKAVAENTYSKGYLGRLFVSEIDVASTMLRNGAGWFDLPRYEYSNLGKHYQELENIAKKEKAGVWSIEGILPPWEFRMTQFANRVVESKNKLKPRKEVLMWGITGEESTGKGYNVKYDKFPNVTQFYTNLMAIYINKPPQKFSLGVGFSKAFYGQDINAAKGFMYFITFQTKDLLGILSSSTTLRLICNEDRIHLQNGEYDYRVSDERDQETDWLYRISTIRFRLTEKEFEKFIKANQVEFKLGNWEGVISEGQMGAIKNIP